MQPLLRLYKEWTAIRYIAIGVFNTLFSIALYPALYYGLTPLGAGYMKILVIQYVVAVTFSFVTNKRMVFRSGERWYKEYAKFMLLQVGFFLINILYLPTIVVYYDFNPAVGQTVFAVVIVAIGFVWNKNVAFRKTVI